MTFHENHPVDLLDLGVVHLDDFDFGCDVRFSEFETSSIRLLTASYGGDDWSVGGQWEMDPWIRYQIGLELGQINVQRTIESEGSGDGGNDLSDQRVQIGVGWSFDVQTSSANVVHSFVVNHESTVGVFQSGMGGEDGVVWLDNGGGDLRSWVNSEFQL